MANKPTYEELFAICNELLSVFSPDDWPQAFVAYKANINSSPEDLSVEHGLFYVHEAHKEIILRARELMGGTCDNTIESNESK